MAALFSSDSCWRGAGLDADNFSLQTPEKAVAFYNDKVNGLDGNLQELEKIVQSKSSQLRVVEESKFCHCRI